MKLPWVLASTVLALAACNVTQNLGGGSGGATMSGDTGGTTTTTSTMTTSSTTTSSTTTTTTTPSPSCTDGIKDGNESDVDCGGGACPACVNGKHCSVNTDCTSDDCVNNVCVAGSGPTCTDGIKDGNESDVDCGGGLCPACANGKDCFINTDCTSDDCVNNVCVAGSGPTCTDGIKDGNESDVDCGGGFCPACVTGKHCFINTDCVTDNCVNNVCAPAGGGPTCTDGIKNGNESDVDCGGGACPTCAMGKHCLVNADCTSDDCVNNVCH